MSASKPKPAPAPIGDSWDVKNWPPSVWPNSAKRARWILRSARNSLDEAGALTRYKRELIINGDAYRRWLFSPAMRRAVGEFSNNLIKESA
jgi:hypothetical protein